MEDDIKFCIRDLAFSDNSLNVFNYTQFSNGLSLMLVLVVMYSLIYIIANAVIYNHVLAQ